MSTPLSPEEIARIVEELGGTPPDQPAPEPPEEVPDGDAPVG
ncbi:hypothetical protein [Streptomyces sp. MP131-18]|nr:hypothetical protein [Streptomyces sp. MP131-18]ONK09426.1 hypothetical protein STBA_01260 [Streptomyces sp. MP131-18]